MHPRFPDTGLLPHPVGLGVFKERRLEQLFSEKSKCSKQKVSSSMAEKSGILKMFSFGFD
jgi:hypothetical protein